MRTICLATPVEEPDRYTAAIDHFRDVGLTTVEFCYGLHKETSGLITTHPYMVDRTIGQDDVYQIGPHPTNIWIGHYMIWNALLLSNDREWFVLECDAKFPKDWSERFCTVLDYAISLEKTEGRYDLIYMGSCCTEGRPKTCLSMFADGSGAGLYRMAGTAPQCNHAYVVTREAAFVMVNAMRRIWAPVDVQQASECWGDPLRNHVPMVAPPRRKLNVFTVLPRIVDQWGTEIGA